MEYLSYILLVIAYFLVGTITVLVYYVPKQKDDSIWKIVITFIVWPLALLIIIPILTFFIVHYMIYGNKY